jgi:hypothetical protein
MKIIWCWKKTVIVLAIIMAASALILPLQSCTETTDLPKATMVNPDEGKQGDDLLVTISGTFFSQSTAVDFGSGVTVNSLTHESPTLLTADITIDTDAPAGARDVSVTTSGGTATLPDGFNVIQAIPTVDSIDPRESNRGNTLVVYIEGADFTGVTSVSFGDGITVNNFNIDTADQISANITIAANATTGTRDVSVATSGHTATLPGSFTVRKIPPIINSIDPDRSYHGDTNIFTGATSISFGDGITVNSFTVASSTQITANITIDGDATPGTRDVSITTHGGTATLRGGFTVLQSPPTITSINPRESNRGIILFVYITGTSFHGATSVSFGDDVTVNSFNMDTPTQITAIVTIDADAATGVRDVSVATPAGTATVVGGFTIIYLPPTINLIDPIEGIRGTTIVVYLTGTNFTGTTLVSFGDGITVLGFNVDTSNQISATINIAADAVTGPRDVWVTTPVGTVILTGGFTVI